MSKNDYTEKYQKISESLKGLTAEQVCALGEATKCGVFCYIPAGDADRYDDLVHAVTGRIMELIMNEQRLFKIHKALLVVESRGRG